jgi:hypothetical protein
LSLASHPDCRATGDRPQRWTGGSCMTEKRRGKGMGGGTKPPDTKAHPKTRLEPWQTEHYEFLGNRDDDDPKHTVVDTFEKVKVARKAAEASTKQGHARVHETLGLALRMHWIAQRSPQEQAAFEQLLRDQNISARSDANKYTALAKLCFPDRGSTDYHRYARVLEIAVAKRWSSRQFVYQLNTNGGMDGLLGPDAKVKATRRWRDVCRRTVHIVRLRQKKPSAYLEVKENELPSDEDTYSGFSVGLFRSKGDKLALIGFVPFRESLVKQAITLLGSTLPRKLHRSQGE